MGPAAQARAWFGVNGAIVLIAAVTSGAARLTEYATAAECQLLQVPLKSAIVVPLTYMLVFAAASFNLRGRARSTAHGRGEGGGEPSLRWHDIVWHPLAAVVEKILWRRQLSVSSPAVLVASVASAAPSLLFRLFLFEVVYDLLFYWSHRLCHTKLLYQAVHKTHHRHRHGLTLLSTLNMSPADVMITHSVPLLLALRVVPMHTDFEYQLAKAYLLFQEFYGHAGVQHKGRNFGPLPWIPTALGMDLRADDHQWHHIDGRYNFSKRFSLWDKVFGTWSVHGRPDSSATERAVLKRE